MAGGTTPACAACRYQRRKCASDCLFAPYFPANEPLKFQSVHRLFGVSNVTKILVCINDKEQRDDAVKALIYEAEMRRKFPVEGCMAPLNFLGSLYQQKLKEYRLVLQFLASYRTSAGIDQPASSSQFLVNNDNGFMFENSGKPLSFPDPSGIKQLQMQSFNNVTTTTESINRHAQSRDETNNGSGVHLLGFRRSHGSADQRKQLG